MAVVAPVPLVQSGSGNIIQWSWTLANGDTGQGIAIPNNFDSTVHVYGTFGLNGSVSIMGSNNPVDLQTVASSGSWVVLTDPQGNALTKTALSIEAILEQPLYLAPKCTAGDGTTAIVINLIMRRKGLN